MTTNAPELPVDKTPPDVVHVTAIQLADAVALVKPHLGNDDTLPILTTYRLDVRDGALWLSATDRYSVGAARIQPYEDPISGMQKFPAGFKARVSRKLIQQVLSIFKPDRRNTWFDPRIAIKASGQQIVVEQRNLVEGLLPTRLTEQVADLGRDLDLLGLLKTIAEACHGAKEGPALNASFNALYLDRFASVPKVVTGSNNGALTIRQAGPSKPLLATCGEGFIGALMPVKYTAEPDLDVWVKRLTATPAARRKAKSA